MTVAAPEAIRLPGIFADGDDDWIVVPQTYGPTWDKDLSWTGPRDPEDYILPELTLGWQAVKWIEANLLADETDADDKPLPFSLTNEQIRFILWFYAIDEEGRFLYREIVLQRLKGWGKDPLAACISAVEFVGPCRFAGWAAAADPETHPEQYAKDVARLAAIGLEPGDPYAKPHPRAWVQIAAVSLVQTQNTMTLFQGLFTDACKAEHSIDLGKEVIYAYHGKKKIQAVTSSPRALEGNRPTLVIKNETHHWIKGNDGIAMADAIERNATKAKGGAARTLSITNAYEPSEESVAKQEREAWESGESGRGIKTDTMYDSLEAPKKANLRPWSRNKTPEGKTPEEIEVLIRRYLTRVIEAVRGDAWWLDIPSLVSSILNPKNKPSRSRRFWFNQVVASEDSWVDPAAVEAAINQMVRENRLITGRSSAEVLKAGWDIVHPDEPIVMTFDGSKSDDSTVLIGTRVSDGFQFVIGVWQAPPKKRNEDKTWLVPRLDVDMRVDEAFKRFNIVAFWADPSHAKDDEDSSRYWDGLIDGWMRRHKDKLDEHFWPVKSGLRVHAIMWDMSSPMNQATFVGAAEEYVTSMERLDDIEEFAPEFTIDGHPAFVDHLLNARRYLHPSGYGVSLMKENRESAKKIDLAVCAVMGRMLRRLVMNRGVEEEEKPGEVWGVGW